MEVQAGSAASPFSRTREWAISDADKIIEKSASATCPPIATVSGLVSAAFTSAYEVAIKSISREEIEPSALAISFMKIDECRRRIRDLPDKIWLEIWPGTPGHAFAGYSGRSGYDVVMCFVTAIYSALMITFGYSKGHDRFPRDIEDMPISGPEMTDHFRRWSNRAALQVSSKSIHATSVAQFREDAGKIWSIFLSEAEKAEKQLLELESMSWLSLLVFSHQATRSWAEHPRFSDRTRALEGRLRQAAKDAGVVGTDAEDWVICRNLTDLLVVRRGYTASAAGQISISDVTSLLETGALSAPRLGVATSERPKYHYIDERTKEVQWSDELVGFVYLADALAMLNGHAAKMNLRTPSLGEFAKMLDTPGNPVHHMVRKREGGARNNRRVLVDDLLPNVRNLLRAFAE